MKAKTLFILLLVLVALGSMAFFTQKKKEAAAKPEWSPGALLFETLDVNRVAGVRITAPGSTTDVVKKEGRWVLPGLYDYPVDFEKLVEQLLKIEELEIGQVIRGGTDYLGEFGLQDRPTRIQLYDDNQKEVAQLSIGTTRMSKNQGPYGGFPQGQYLRVQEGPVVLVDEDFSYFPKQSSEWVDRALLAIVEEDIREIHVAKGETSYVLKVNGRNTYELEDLDGANEELDTAMAGRLARAFQSLQLTSVADPETSDTALGFDTPDKVVVKSHKGILYTTLLGSKPDPNNQHVRFQVSYEKPSAPDRLAIEANIPPDPPASPDEEGKPATPPRPRAERVAEAYQAALKQYEAECAAHEKEARELADRLSRWTYILGTYTVESLSLDRAQLAKTIPPPGEKETLEQPDPADSAGDGTL